MQIGIFGGTFDPVHVGHLILAEQAREQGNLDQIWFVPAPRPPQKHGISITRFDLRIEMLSLAIAGHAAFHIDPIEQERAGPSYTVDTLTALTQRYPEHRFHLLIGGDSLVDLPTWRDPQGILAHAALLVMARPGVTPATAEELRVRLGLPPDRPPQMTVIRAPLIDIASRDLRQRVHDGRSIRFMVPRSVEIFIRERGLYRQDEKEALPLEEPHHGCC